MLLHKRGYTRDVKVLSRLGLKTEQQQDISIGCLIIYMYKTVSEKLADNFLKITIKLSIISD